MMWSGDVVLFIVYKYSYEKKKNYYNVFCSCNRRNVCSITIFTSIYYIAIACFDIVKSLYLGYAHKNIYVLWQI